MSHEPIDPTPFEPFMPDDVRAVIAEARAGRGPAAQWLVARGGGWAQVGESFGLLRGHPEPLAPRVVGWLVGIAMFGDDLYALPRVIVRERHASAVEHVIDAFVAGIEAGVAPMRRQWRSVEALVEFAGRVPARLLDALPAGLASDQALARGVALKLAQRAGRAARATIERARRGAAGSAAARLDEALAALAAGATSAGGDAAGAPAGDGAASALLARLLAEWARTHDPALHAAIAAAGADAGRDRPPLQARSKGELEGAWLAVARARDPADVDRLLGAPWPGAWKLARARVAALAEFPADPRVGKGLLAAAPRYTSNASEPLHRSIADVLDRVADPTSVDALRALEGARSYAGRGRYGAVAARCAAVVPVAADPALIAAATGARRQSAVGLAALWASFWDDPRDASRRIVLADALQAAGDPRGEFIVAQLTIADGRADAKTRRRASELLDAHIDTWTGPLPSIERASRRFERGFLVAARTTAGPDAILASLDAPEWRTVEHLDYDSWGGPAALVARLVSLRTLVVHDAAIAERVANGPPHPSLRALVCHRRWFPPGPCPGIPRLTVLDPGPEWPFASDADGLAALARVGIAAAILPTARLSALRAWRAGVGPAELRFVDASWRAALGAVGWRVAVRRDDPCARVAWGGGPSWQRTGCEELVRALAGEGFREVRIYAGPVAKTAELLTRGTKALAPSLAGVTVRYDGEPIDLTAVPAGDAAPSIRHSAGT